MNEVDERPYLGLGLGGAIEAIERFLELKARAIQHAVGAANVADLLGTEAAARQTLDVDAVRNRGSPDRHDVRRYVARHHGVVCDEGMRADARKLVRGGETPENRPIADVDVAPERRTIGENDLIAE